MTIASDDDASEPFLSNRMLFRITLVIGLLAALASGLSIAGRWLGKELALGGNTDSTALQYVVVGQDTLALPSNVIRFERQRRSGRAESVSIFLTWPRMEGYSRQNAATFSDTDAGTDLLFVDFSQSVMSRDMSGRVEPIYSKLFEGPASDGPAGLRVHALTRKSGFGDERLLTGTLDDGGVYAVRCLLPSDDQASTTADCLRDVRIGRDLTMLYRFPARLLPQWKAIDMALTAYATRRLAN